MPSATLLLFCMVLGMGFRHGLDPDHLTAIDAILRFQASQKHHLNRWAGLYFSLGHGMVVLTLALLVAGMNIHWDTPAGLLLFGGLFSGTFLLGMAGVNGLELLRSDSSKRFIPLGARSSLILHFLPLERPFFIFLMGMLFAISFDTVSQTVIFSWVALRMGGVEETFAAGLVFTFGMILSDGTNGLWIARLIVKADQNGVRLSRAMGWMFVSMSFLIGIYVLVTTLFPSLPIDSPFIETIIGLGIIFSLTIFYIVSRGFLMDRQSKIVSKSQ